MVNQAMASFASACLLGCLGCVFLHFCYVLLLRPWGSLLRFRRQGIRGPRPSLVMGNIPEMRFLRLVARKADNLGTEEALQQDCCPTLFPYFEQWTKQYGRKFVFALGRTQVLYVTDPNLVKEVNVFKSLDLGKPAYLQKDRGPLLGKGIITTNGAVWSHQRKTASPQLYMEKVKAMMNEMVDTASELVRSWERIVQTEGGTAEITVDRQVRSFTSKIISQMMFGKDFTKGVEMFPPFRALIRAMETPTILSGIPFARFLPTKRNKEIWKLEKDIHSMIMSIVKGRSQDTTTQDILGVLVEASKCGELGSLTRDQFIVDNCKGLYLAAFEVTGIATMWGLMLLAGHPEWQARARAEVLEVSGGKRITNDMLSKMKVLKMVILEVLRLYPVVAFVSRQALQDLKIGNVCVPKGVCIWMWLLALHRDPELWGPEPNKFNPARFANGVTGACKFPQAYAPFGVGNRVCPGQSLAVTEMKVLLATILANFSLALSPNYHHSPHFGLLLEPEHGVQLLVQKLAK